MALKYQHEIDNFGLDIQCPENVVAPIEITAYRWSFNPIGHALNFLPNVVYDRVTNNPFNYKTAKSNVKCRRCSASYFTNIDSARDKWEGISLQIRLNLGYTHISSGILDENDGVMKEPDKEGHFGFYESDTANLATKFTIVEELNVTS